MAAVWVAHNETLDINVAIKFIRTDLKHAGLTGRLLQEARAAARLGHSAIVRILDFGKTDTDEPYIVMELLNGEDLGATLKRNGPMPPVKAVRTLIPIVDALAVAHSKRIVHRDLKPENIFLSDGESGKPQPKLVDFGIAKLEKDGMERITQIGATMGSPAYMSPEQARGLDVDPRSDIWALCVVLYELTTGELPFTGVTYTALVCSILESTPKPMTEVGAGDPELWSIVERGLQKDPANRWQSMRDLGTSLARWLLAHGVNADVTGASLQSAWLDRPMNSESMTAPTYPSLPAGSLTPASNPSNPVAGSSTGPGATQLSATTAAGLRARSRPKWAIMIAATVVLLGIGGGVAYKLGARSTESTIEAPSEPGATEAPVTTATPAASQVPPTPPQTAAPEPTVEPAPAATPSQTAPVRAAPRPRLAKPSSKPPASKSSKPPSNPPAAATDKPPPKSDPLDIKTTL